MLVVAHRGASWDLPENTLPAFELAIEQGADAIELDVHALSDGTLAVTHDAPKAGVAYPSLEEALDLARGRIEVMVELKSPHRYRRHDVVRRTLALLDEGEHYLLSFEPAAIAEARRLRPRLRTIQHVRHVPIRVAAALGCWGAGFRDDRATARRLAFARRLGLEPTVYTVNEPARIVELRALGVAGVFTDRPALALEALGRRG
jgi:glycerophosphoryl diester phosphodiesterase